MIRHRLVMILDGAVQCLSDLLRPVCAVCSCWLPSSVEVICDSCFCSDNGLASVTYDANLGLSRLETQDRGIAGRVKSQMG
jgi:hypothetical protein